MRKLLFISCLLLILSSFKKEEGKTILIILAHPDDETTIGAMMAKYALQNKVYYIVATDGRYGTRINKIPEDSLIEIRKEECACSCRQLGIDPPIMLNFHDGFGIKTGVGEYFKQTKAMKKKLIEQIEIIDPDYIITFGPDGDTGHPDHRIIGDIITEIILSKDWYNKYPLYYLGWTKVQAAKFGIEELNYVNDKYFNISVTFSDADEAKYFKSIQCHKSQNTPQEIEDWINTEKQDTSNVLYFRKFYADTTKRGSF